VAKQITVTIKDDKGAVLHAETVNPRTFSSGKAGFGAYGKVNDGADRYQLSFNLVKLAAK